MPPRNTPLRCLVVDDSTVYRKIVRDVLDELPDVDVIGCAKDGAFALEQIERLKPDLVTLDLEMPRLDGIGVLRELKTRGLSPAAIMVSAFTARGAKATTSALQLGAFDFILKPTTSSIDESVQQLRHDLIPKLRACQTRLRSRRALGETSRVAAPAKARPTRPQPNRPRVSLPGVKPAVVAIGVSTGGPQALSRVLPKLPANFPTPIVCVQHMPRMFTKSLADDLNRHCKLTVSEASNGQPLRAGEVLIAPGGRQMRIVAAGGGHAIQLTDDPPERNCRPSVDYTFRSVADHFGARALGVILTGMGDDGTIGAKAMKEKNAAIYAQDEASCVVYGMPKSIIDNGLADIVAPLEQIAERILGATNGRVAV